MINRPTDLDPAAARQGSATRFLPLFALTLILTLCACADPGTGGSGVPSGSSGPANEAPAAGGGTGTASAPAPAPSTPAADNGSLVGAVQVAPGSNTAALPTTAAGSAPVLVVNGTRFALGAATVQGADGTPRSLEQLKPGVPVSIRFAATANLAGAANSAAGAPIDAISVTVADPSPGIVVSSAAIAPDAPTLAILFDDGRRLALSATVVVAGAPNGSARVRAWVLTPASGASVVSRYEFE